MEKLTKKEKKMYTKCIKDLRGVSKVKTIPSMSDSELKEFVIDLRDTRRHIDANKGVGYEYADMTLKGLETATNTELTKRNIKL